MAVKLKWHGEELKRFSEKALMEGLVAAGTELHRISQQRASVVNPPQSVPVKRVRKSGNAKSRTVYTQSSKPGESPRQRTGFGRKNIVMNVLRRLKAVRVGYTRAARYMIYHELGIRYSKVGFQQRSTIVPSLEDNLNRLGSIFRRTVVRAARK